MLRTNEHALRFYRRLHARGLDEIEILRLDGDHLRDLASTVLPPAEPDVWGAGPAAS